MQRVHKHFSIGNIPKIKDNLLIWGNQFTMVAWLDSNNNTKATHEGYLAVNAITQLKSNHTDAFEKLKQYIDSIHDYAFGYLGYDLKNDTEDLESNNLDSNEFPDLCFFQPEKVIEITKDSIIFRYPLSLQDEIESDWINIKETTSILSTSNHLIIKSRIDKKTYINQADKILKDIHLGKIYELNYCQEFFAENATIAPLETYLKLNKISSAPFATFLKIEDLFLLSGSPERFLKKTKDVLLSEPIKGTAKRSTNIKEDNIHIDNLKNNTKEIAENVMIVDLVRNDLSHIAKKGTVNVDELCEIYTFKQVHQMISSISCTIKDNIHPVDAIKACYPMGSMTGAPKIAAMRTIENLEATKRGLYSGAVGYFTPTQDFDFNVVIRSILYNQTKKHISFSVGSAITAKANPEQEYEECILKAKAMREVLTQ